MPKLPMVGVKGLWTSTNKLQAPAGSLSEAMNVVIREPGVAQNRRGFLEWSGATWATAADASSLYAWRDGSTFMLFALTSTTLQKTTDSAVTAYSGTYTAADTRMNFAEAKECAYFTSAVGVYRLDAHGGTPIVAGLQKPLSMSIATHATSTWLTDPGAVAYRAVLKFTDAKGNVYLSAPSARTVYRNSGGGTIALTVTVTLPADVTASCVIQLYRSSQTTTADAEPSDEVGLVYERAITSSEVTAKSLAITDVVPDAMRGATGYFSPSQEGILNGNERPPRAYDIAWHKQTMFYAGCTSKHRLTIRLLNTTATGSAWAASTFYSSGDVVINDGGKIYTADTTGLSAASGGPTGTGTNIVDNAARWDYTGVATAIHAGATVTIAGQTYTARGSGASTPEYNITTSSTQQVNVRATAQALCDAINTYASNTTVYAYYASKPDEAAGIITIEERGLGGNSFAATSSLPATWAPELPSSGTTISSSNDEALNRVYYSKPLEPEAVPLLNYVDVGSAADPIVRIVSLRDSLFVFKRREGIFRITGQANALTVSEHDRTVNIVGRQTIASLTNELYLFSNMGVVAVSDVGVRVVSGPIKNDLATFARNGNNTHNVAHATADEQDGIYILWLPESSSATLKGWIYCPRTDAWTRHDYQASASTSGQSDSSGSGFRRVFIVKESTGRKILRTSINNDGGEDPADAAIACALTWNLAVGNDPAAMKQWTRADFLVSPAITTDPLPATLTAGFRTDIGGAEVNETTVSVATTAGALVASCSIPSEQQLATAMVIGLDASVAISKSFTCSGLVLTLEEGGDSAGR